MPIESLDPEGDDAKGVPEFKKKTGRCFFSK